jgi:peptide/nickel transport system ATP-binding protein
MSVEEQEGPLLEVTELRKYFPIRGGFFKRVMGYVKAVDDVSLYVMEGETLGLVGESGCGKTTTGRSIMRAIEPTSGSVVFRDPKMGPVSVTELDKDGIRQIRRSMRMIFQDPYASLNPRMTLLDIVGAPLKAMNLARGKELENRVAEMLRRVGLAPEYMRRYPHAFSGGQRQRIGLARALAPEPKFVVCDEPVSALDVSSAGELFTAPKHPYTEALMAAIPRPDPRPRQKHIVLAGEVANPANPPSGCYFHPRCRYAEQVCRDEAPVWDEIAEGHFVRCHRARELELVGAVGLV